MYQTAPMYQGIYKGGLFEEVPSLHLVCMHKD